MTSKEMIKEMIEMQIALDNAVYKEHNTYFDRRRTIIALIDEVGELTHELKSEWCWWKKTVKTKDNAKVLEELVDCWHFALSLHYHMHGVKVDIQGFDLDYIKKRNHDIIYIIQWLINETGRETLFMISALTFKLGYEIEDVYKAYIEKNKINYERLKGGY